MSETIVKIKGMTCDNCALNVKNSLLDVKGVLEAEVSLAENEARVIYDNVLPDLSEIDNAVVNAGYSTVTPDNAEASGSITRGGVVAMVVDGISDATALKQANEGIAIGTGTNIAIEASDVTLVRGDLSSVVSAVKLSKATFRKIRQNLFWAYFYNTIAIPAAILGFLHPVIAEAAMATSSINVVTNANLLRFAKIKSGS